ncbi:MAG: ribosome maturation factor RimP [Fidelibacterota bacterium]
MELKAELEKLADQCGVILLSSSISKEGEPPFVRLIVDTETGVTLDEIVQIHKKLKQLEIFSQYFPNGFRSEVTSPGFDYPLTHGFQFSRNLKRRMQLSPKNEEVNSKVVGVLEEFDGVTLRMSTDKGEIFFPFDALKEGKLVFE